MGLAEPSERLHPPLSAPLGHPPPRFFEFSSDDTARVVGWDGLAETEVSWGEDGGAAQAVLGLPSFTGRLRSQQGVKTPLLRYPP